MMSIGVVPNAGCPKMLARDGVDMTAAELGPAFMPPAHAATRKLKTSLKRVFMLLSLSVGRRPGRFARRSRFYATHGLRVCRSVVGLGQVLSYAPLRRSAWTGRLY